MRFKKSNLDLKLLLKANKDEVPVRVFYAKNHRLDNIHAQRLKGFSSVDLVCVDKGGHQVVKELKQSGYLSNLMQEIF